MAQRSTGSTIFNETTYNFATDFDEVVTVSHGGVAGTNTTVELTWDTSGGTPLAGLDGIFQIFTTNDEENTTPLTEATENLFPSGFPINVDKGSESFVLQYPHENVRMKYNHNSNSGTGILKLTYKSVIV
jgi:hypothetical protein